MADEGVTSEDYRRWIKEAGLRLFVRDGVQAVSVAQICRDADVANGTFYNFYRNKSELVAEFMTDAYEGLAARLREAEAVDDNPYARHRRDVTIIVDFSAEKRDLISLTLRDDGARRLTEKNVKDLFIDQRTKSMRRDIERGIFLGGIDPVLLARSESALMTECIGWWIENPDAITREDLIDRLVAIRLRLTNGEVSCGGGA